MGCTGSKLVADQPNSSLDSKPPLKDAPSGTRRNQARLSIAGGYGQYESMNAAQVVFDNDNHENFLEADSSNGVEIHYAFLSQRGHYPDQPNKANQDAIFVKECVNGQQGQHIFCVLDGHGETGAECAQFAKAKLQMLLPADTKLRTDPEGALSRVLTTTNTDLHKSLIDDSLSGTTACLALIQGRSVYVANVGDSRAVLAQRSTAVEASHSPDTPGSEASAAADATAHAHSLIAVELTADQTPFRDDECERVQKCGARVMTLDQMEGLKERGIKCWTNEENCDGDPPRLWAQNGTYPGTAFTRSIGDSVAEAIGVFAEPEISKIELTEENPFLILASDGVWEFISSQRAVEIVASCKDPQDAVRALVNTAYKTWLVRETRTDDISVAVLFFSPPGAVQNASQATPEEMQA